MARLTRNVVLLAAASLVADVSGEMLMAVLPFLLVAQGAGPVAVGLVGGATDAVGHAVKAVGGALADRFRRRKPFIVAGYLVAALARFGVAASTTWVATLAMRGADRLGKGLRTAPRDALLAESAAPGARGRAFGFHRAADTAGALVGAVAAFVAVSAMGAAPATVVFASAAIGLLTLAPLAFVRDIRARASSQSEDVLEAGEPPSPRYGAFLAIASVFALGNVSYLFFLLRAGDVLGGPAAALALYVLFNAVYLALAFPAGAAGDRWGRPRVLAAGFLAFAISSALLVAPWGPVPVVGAFALLGVAFAAVDGTERAWAADLAGARRRATRLGRFHAVVGLSAVIGGLVAGGLWRVGGPAWTFAWGAFLPVVAFGALAWGGFLKRAA